MDSFVHKHADKITGILCCFDRMILKGYLPFSYARGMEGFLSRQNILIKDFPKLAKEQSTLVKEHARRLAEQAGRPVIPVRYKVRKEDEARKLAQQDGITEGLVCVFTTQEASPSFKIAYGVGRPRLVPSRPRCLVLYFYFLDPEFGLVHIRLPTWFPFTIQVYVNGHEWLARRFAMEGIGCTPCDNAFLAIDDFDKAQRLADQLCHCKWRRFLDALAQRVNPLLTGLLKDCDYYWVIDQAEYALDVLFKDRDHLQLLYRRLLEHATLAFSAEDVLSFLGKKLIRQPGRRRRHRLQEAATRISRQASSRRQLAEDVRQVRPGAAHRDGHQPATLFQGVSLGYSEGSARPRLVSLNEERRFPRPFRRGVTPGHAPLPGGVGRGRGPSSQRACLGPRLHSGPL